MRTSSRSLAFGTLRIAVYASLPLFLLYAALDELNPGGTRTYRYTIDRRSPNVSQLFPEQRLARITNGTQRVMSEPVYFTVRYPVPYALAEVRIVVANPDDLQWQVGIERGAADAWAYELANPDESGAVTFALQGARVTNSRLRFIIGVPQLTPTSTFGIRDISITLRRHD